MNGKSSRCDVSKERNCHRLKAVLDYSFCEVRPGVGPVKKMKSDPVNRRPGETKSLQPGTEVRTLRGKREKAKVPFKKSGTADILRLLCKARDEVFLFLVC